MRTFFLFLVSASVAASNHVRLRRRSGSSSKLSGQVVEYGAYWLARLSSIHLPAASHQISARGRRELRCALQLFLLLNYEHISHASSTRDAEVASGASCGATSSCVRLLPIHSHPLTLVVFSTFTLSSCAFSSISRSSSLHLPSSRSCRPILRRASRAGLFPSSIASLLPTPQVGFCRTTQLKGSRGPQVFLALCARHIVSIALNSAGRAHTIANLPAIRHASQPPADEEGITICSFIVRS